MTAAHKQSYDIAVIGGGIAGLAVAFEAARRGMRTVVLERDRLGAGATGVAAGMLAPVSEAAFGELELLELNLDSAARYPDWAAAVSELSGVDPGYRACGTLVVARDRDQAEALERELSFRRDRGLAAERLLGSDARRREPGLAPAIRLAADIPGDHAVDPARLVAALGAAIEHEKGELREGAEVAAVACEGERVCGVTLAGGASIAAGAVVVAAGCWSGRIGGPAADASVSVRPVKGQLLRLRDPAGAGLLKRVVRSEDAYLVPRGDGRYVLGATVEERGFDTTVTAGATFELLREAIDLVPGVAELEVEEALAGLRPGTPDNAPVLGPGAREGLHWATGHYRHGVLLAPVTGAAVLAGITGEPPPEAARPFRAGRFASRVAA